MTKSIKRRGTEGVCTGEKFGSSSCPAGSKRYNLAKTFRKMARNREYGGNLPEYDGLSTDSMYLPSNDYGITGSKYYSTPTNRFEIPSGPVVNSTAQMQKDLGITSTGNIRLSEDKQRLGTEWTPYSGAGWESTIGLVAPIVGNVANMIAARRNKGKYNVEVPEAHATPTPISLERVS